ncbi:MAG: hypothetical protein AAF570_08065, partial [Bacteroidota bacterium]
MDELDNRLKAHFEAQQPDPEWINALAAEIEAQSEGQVEAETPSRSLPAESPEAGPRRFSPWWLMAAAVVLLAALAITLRTSEPSAPSEAELLRAYA